VRLLQRTNNLGNSSSYEEQDENAITHDTLLTSAVDIVAATIEDVSPFMQQYFGPHESSIAKLYACADEPVSKILDHYIKMKNLKTMLEDLRRRTRSNQVLELDPRDLDLTLSEISTISSRIETIDVRFNSRLTS
jgi:hypothetical protein